LRGGKGRKGVEEREGGKGERRGKRRDGGKGRRGKGPSPLEKKSWRRHCSPPINGQCTNFIDVTL